MNVPHVNDNYSTHITATTFLRKNDYVDIIDFYLRMLILDTANNDTLSENKTVRRAEGDCDFN